MFDQIVVGAAPGDAITTNALLLQRELERLGPAELYAQHREPGLPRPVRSLDELPYRPNRDRPIVFHASMGSWPVYRALQAEPSIVLVYHNFSPAEPYIALAPDVAGDLTRGRWELAQIRDRVVKAIADSDYNVGELEELGYRDITVVPPTPDVFRLGHAIPDIGLLQEMNTWGPGPFVLTVAQKLPHKRIERVITAMAILQQEFLPDARLVHVGVDRFPSYSRALHDHADAVGLSQPHFLGRVTEEQLAALYLRADAFLTLSDHEGFCVPVIEAMSLGVPVVAADRAALPGTVGMGGVIVDPDDLLDTAAVLHRVLTDTDLRNILIGRGVSRARELDASSSLPQLVNAVLATETDPAAVVADQIAARLRAEA